MTRIASAKPTWARPGVAIEVADGPHAVLAGAAPLVDLDEAPLVDLHAGAVEARASPTAAGGRPTR